MNKNQFKKAKQLIKESKKILVMGHINPDLDSIATVLALYRGLKKINKQVEVWSQTKIPGNNQFLKDVCVIKTPPYQEKKFDLIITVDTPVLERLGDDILPVIKKTKKIINIDHHISNKNYGALNMVDGKACACGEIIYHLLNELNIKIDLNIAEYIYTSILTDTGGFRFGNTTYLTHTIAAEMLIIGVDPEKIFREVYENISLSKVRLWRIVLKRLKIIFKGKACILVLNHQDYQKAGAKKEDTDGFIEYARSIKGVLIAVFFEELSDRKTIKIGFRSNDKKYDVNKLAKVLGGGGHKGASGARVQGSMKDVQKRVYKEISKIM